MTIDTPGVVNLALADPDPDGDGDQDIMLTMRTHWRAGSDAKPGIGWIEQKSAREWVYKDISVNVGLNEMRTLQTIDINQNGVDEIISSNSEDGSTWIFSLDPMGEWSRWEITGIGAVNSHYNLVHDVNGDGLADFVFGRGDGIYFADMSKDLLAPEIQKISSLHGITNAVITEIVAADLNQDGSDELIFSLRGVGVYYSIPPSKTEEWSTHWVSFQAQNYHGVRIIDYDGDGRLDVLANVEYPANRLELWHQVPTN